MSLQLTFFCMLAVQALLLVGHAAVGTAAHVLLVTAGWLGPNVPCLFLLREQAGRAVLSHPSSLPP